MIVELEWAFEICSIPVLVAEGEIRQWWYYHWQQRALRLLQAPKRAKAERSSPQNCHMNAGTAQRDTFVIQR